MEGSVGGREDVEGIDACLLMTGSHDLGDDPSSVGPLSLLCEAPLPPLLPGRYSGRQVALVYYA